MSTHRVVIAGGSGFVGRSLAAALKDNFTVRILGRSVPEAEFQGLELRTCDLFSLLQIEQALENCHTAIYLVHSMAPNNGLTQGNFQDIDLIAADNFARSAAAAGVKKIIYLGGLIPDTEPLSPHLESRLEVERVLASHGVPLVVVRAGLIIGPGGSSYKILRNLVKRLPVMVCPAWTLSKTQPVAIADAVSTLAYCTDTNYADIVTSIDGPYKILNVGTKEVVTYKSLIAQTGRVMGRHTKIFTVPINSYPLSRLWVKWFSSSSSNLVDPLVESLKHDMLATNNVLLKEEVLGRPPQNLEQMIQLAESQPQEPTYPRMKNVTQDYVRSVQRLPIPQGRNAHWLVYRYGVWLKKYFRHVFDIRIRSGSIYFYKSNLLLLELSYAPERSNKDRALFYITSGLLLKNGHDGKGRLEFRIADNNRVAIAAIHDFQPSLPWFVYMHIQAPIHLFVMDKFTEYLHGYAQRRSALPEAAPVIT